MYKPGKKGRVEDENRRVVQTSAGKKGETRKARTSARKRKNLNEDKSGSSLETIMDPLKKDDQVSRN